MKVEIAYSEISKKTGLNSAKEYFNLYSRPVAGANSL